MGEAKIYIQDSLLSEAQSMAIRCACTFFHAELHNGRLELGDDDHGIFMKKAYIQRMSEVLEIMRHK